MTEATFVAPEAPAAVWEVEDENGTAPAEDTAVSEAVSAEAAPAEAPAAPELPRLPEGPIDLTALTPAQRRELIKSLSQVAKVERAAAAAEKAKRVGATDTTELDKHMFSDVAPKVLALPKTTTEKDTVGFHRHTGSYVHDGVRYSVTVTARVAGKRGRPARVETPAETPAATPAEAPAEG